MGHNDRLALRKVLLDAATSAFATWQQLANALGDMHDKHTRRHFHLLFGVPPHIQRIEFERVLNEVLRKEPFVYRKRKLEPVRNLANAIGYNVEPAKSRSGNPVIFEAWQQPLSKETDISDNTNQNDRDSLTVRHSGQTVMRYLLFRPPEGEAVFQDLAAPNHFRVPRQVRM